MSETLEIVIKGSDKGANQALQKLSAGLEGVGKVAKVAGAAVVAAIGVQSVRAVLDLAAQGTRLTATRQTFENLATSIGTTGEALLGKLRPATRGMVSDMDLVASTNRFVSMRLAETADEAANLSEMAVQLGMAMGKDANSAMEEFALLLANQSIPRLDTFGISAGRVRSRIEELQAADSNLTREQAFLTAVMEEGEVAMGRVGEQGGNAAASLASLNTAMRNARDELAMRLAPAFAELIRPITSLANRFLPELVAAFGGVIGAIMQTGGLIIGEFARWVNIAPGWGQSFGQSFADGIASAIPYILGVIRAIGKIIAYWFAPGSPPKIAEEIDAWGLAMVQEFFGAFGQVPLGDIITLQKRVGDIFSDALEYGLIGDTQASAMLEPVTAQLKAMQSELINTGRVGEDSFEALANLGGALGPSLVDAARSFFRFTDATEMAAGPAGTIADALKAITEEAEEAAGGGGGGSAAEQIEAIAESLAGGYATGAPAKVGFALPFDTEAIDAQAESIAGSITDKIFPVIDGIREKWNEITGYITGPLEAAKTWIDEHWPTVQVPLQKALTNVKLWIDTAWPKAADAVSGALSTAKTWIDTNWPGVESTVKAALSNVKTWIDTQWPGATSTVTSALDSVKMWASQGWKAASTAISSAYTAAKKWVDEKWPTARVSFGLYVDQMAEYLELGWETFATSIGTAYDKVKPWLELTWEAATTNIAGAVTAIGDLFGLDWSTVSLNVSDFTTKATDLFALGWDTAATSITTAWDAISKWASEVAPNITSNIKAVYDAASTLLGLDWSAIELSYEEGGLSGAAAEIKTQLETAIGEVDWVSTAKAVLFGVSGAIVDVTGWAADLSANLNTMLTSTEVTDGVRTAGKGLGLAIIGAIASLFADTAPDAEGNTKPVWLAILTNLASTVVNLGETLLSVAGSFVSGLGDAIVLAVTGEDKRATWIDVGSALGEAIGEGLDGIYAWLEAKLVGEEGILTKALAAVKTFLGIGEATSKFAEIGNEIVNGIITGLDKLWADLKNAFVGEDGIFPKAWREVKSWLGIESPSTVYTTIGEEIVNGLIAGIGNIWANLKAAFVGEDGILPKAWQAVKTFLGIGEGDDADSTVFTTIGEQTIGGLIAGIGNMLSGLKGILFGPEEGVVSLALAALRTFLGFGTETPLFKTVGIGLMGNLMTGIAGKVTDLQTTINSVVEAGRKALFEEGGPFGIVTHWKNTGKSLLDWMGQGIEEHKGGWAEGLFRLIINAINAANPFSNPNVPPPDGGGGGGGGGARALGGPVTAGFPYLVGERGPEMFVPGRSGYIVPNDKLATGTVHNWSVTINSGQPATRIVDDIRYLQMLGAATA